MCRTGWSDLPTDLLREIAARLQVAAVVSLHAVCKSWRNCPDLLSAGKPLLPWLLAPAEKSGKHSPLKLRCVFSKSSYRVAQPSPPYPPATNWVCSTDGATVRYLAIKQLRPTLHDPITGAVTDLPCFPYYIHGHWDENPRGIVYGDGTVFLYGVARDVAGHISRFRAALLRPSEAEWTLVDFCSGDIGWQGEFCAAYHGGRILLTTEPSCRVFTPDSGGGDVQLVASPWKRPLGSYCYWDRPTYILESHGELLCVSVEVYEYRSFVLSVHALEETTPLKEMRWVRREGHRLADRVFFLGSPNSFAVDASLLCGHGGYAYFVYNHSNDLQNFKPGPEQYGVFRYNLVDGNTEFVEPLPADWDNHKCAWLALKPTITSIQACTPPQITGKKIEVRIPKKQQQQKTAPPVTSPSHIYHIHKHYEHNFRVLVHNLPLKVTKSELELFFGKHGRVFSTEITYHKKTKLNLSWHWHRQDGHHACPSG